MKAQIVNSQHCIKIDDHYIEICYYFERDEMTVFVDESQMLRVYHNASKMMVNYSNLIDVAATIYEHWKKKEKQQTTQQ